AASIPLSCSGTALELTVGFTMTPSHIYTSVLFSNDAWTTEIYTLSLHDALPILRSTINTCNPGMGADRQLRPGVIIRADSHQQTRNIRHAEQAPYRVFKDCLAQ